VSIACTGELICVCVCGYVCVCGCICRWCVNNVHGRADIGDLDDDCCTLLVELWQHGLSSAGIPLVCDMTNLYVT